MDEQIVLLDANLQSIGNAPKLASHHADTPLHLAFSCYLLNDQNQLLLTRRADVKKVWPGVWTNSFCGHPMPGESFEAAILRRGEYELGIGDVTDITKALPNYRYKTPPYKGIIENEFCPVFIARTTRQPQPNPQEVGNYRWTTIEALQTDIANDPAIYSYWLKEQLPLLLNARAL